MKKITTTLLFACITFFAEADFWTQLANFPSTGRQLASGFSIGNLGYVTCGDNGSYLTDLWEYDPSTNQWTQLASLPGHGRYGAVVLQFADKAFIVPGRLSLMDYVMEFAI